MQPKSKNLLADSCKVINQLIRIDKFELEYIHLVLSWCSKDDFWRLQIMSLASLRKKGKNGQSKFQNMAASYERDNLSTGDKVMDAQIKANKEFLEMDI
jgi:hypothetical protein